MVNFLFKLFAKNANVQTKKVSFVADGYNANAVNDVFADREAVAVKAPKMNFVADGYNSNVAVGSVGGASALGFFFSLFGNHGDVDFSGNYKLDDQIIYSSDDF